MPEQKKGVPVWVWIVLAVGASIPVMGMLSALAIYGVRKYIAAAKEAATSQPAEPSAPAATSPLGAIPPEGVLLPALPPTGPLAPLQGEPADLSSVMGRARKLANGWQTDAALAGIEATLGAGGLIPTRAGGSAKLTFGPSSFNVSEPRTGLYVVTYDHSGLKGTPVKGNLAHALPEPMCAPERVYDRVAGADASRPLTLRYAADANRRALWWASPSGEAKATPLAFDAQDCRGAAAARR
jgi:hypothetical protein